MTTPLQHNDQLASLLVAQAGEQHVAFTLSEVDTTIPRGRLYTLPGLENLFEGLAIHKERALTVLNRSFFFGPTPPPKTDFRRIVVLRSGHGIVVDDLSFAKTTRVEYQEFDDSVTVVPTLLPDESSIAVQWLLIERATGFSSASPSPQASREEGQVFSFRVEDIQKTFCLALSGLHHIELTREEDLLYSEDLKAWTSALAPGIPLIDLPTALRLAEASHIPTATPIRAQGHVLYVNLSDGSNFGLVMTQNAAEADPGSTQTVSIYEVDALVAAHSPYGALCLSPSGEASLMLNPDRLFEAYFRAVSDASLPHTEDAA